MNDEERITRAQQQLDAINAENERRISAAQELWDQKHAGFSGSGVTIGTSYYLDAALQQRGTTSEEWKIGQARDAYARGDIEIDEFERRVGAVLGVREELPELPYRCLLPAEVERLGVAAPTADPVNPRIDALVSKDQAKFVLTGTPTPGANLRNLAGAPMVPPGHELEGYISVP